MFCLACIVFQLFPDGEGKRFGFVSVSTKEGPYSLSGVVGGKVSFLLLILILILPVRKGGSSRGVLSSQPCNEYLYTHSFLAYPSSHIYVKIKPRGDSSGKKTKGGRLGLLMRLTCLRHLLHTYTHYTESHYHDTTTITITTMPSHITVDPPLLSLLADNAHLFLALVAFLPVLILVRTFFKAVFLALELFGMPREFSFSISFFSSVSTRRIIVFHIHMYGSPILNRM